MTTIDFVFWATYTFLLARYFYMIGWNAALDEVQKISKSANSEEE